MLLYKGSTSMSRRSLWMDPMKNDSTSQAAAFGINLSPALNLTIEEHRA
jgi:hypothetical protein